MQDPREEKERKRGRRSQKRDRDGPGGKPKHPECSRVGIPSSQSGGKPRRLGFSEEG